MKDTIKAWYFSYGISTSPERFQEEIGPVEIYRPATIRDHKLFFANYNEEWGGGTSCIVPQPGSDVLGTAYLVTQAQLDAMHAGGGGYQWSDKYATIGDVPVPVRLLLPEVIGDFAAPSDSYVAKIREGLSYHYRMIEIDAYLRAALGRQQLFRSMKARWSSEAEYPVEYNIGFRRLFPWKGVVRAPWGGAWAAIEPGTETQLYVHDEEEAAFVIAGVGEVRVDDETRPIKKGDVIYFPPDCEHVVRNTDGERPLEVLFIWWGGTDGALWGGVRV